MLNVHRGTIVAIAMTLALGFACSKGGKGISGNAAQPTILASLPKTTGYAMGFSFTKLYGTKIWERLLPKVIEKNKEEFAEMKELCAIDPTHDFERLVMVGDEGFDHDKTLLFVQGKIDEEKVNKCITALAQKKGKKVDIKKDGKITEYASDENKFYSGWAAPNIAVVSPSDKGKDYLSEVLAGKTHAKDNAAFSAMLAKADTDATMWGAVVAPKDGPGAAMFANMGGTEKPAAGYMTLVFTKDLDANMGVRFPTEAGAKDLTDKVNKQADALKAQPFIGDYIKSLQVSAAQTDAVLKLHLTEQQIDSLMALLESNLGGMLGGMGDMGTGDDDDDVPQPAALPVQGLPTTPGQ